MKSEISEADRRAILKEIEDELPTPLSPIAPGFEDRTVRLDRGAPSLRLPEDPPPPAGSDDYGGPPESVVRANGKTTAPPALESFDAIIGRGMSMSARQWLLGNTFCRGVVSGLVSAGAVGKTTVRLLQILSLVTGRALSGEHVFAKGGARCLVVCLEDDRNEFMRRLVATMQLHQVDWLDLGDRLRVLTPDVMSQPDAKIAEYDAKGNVVRGRLEALIRAEIDAYKIDLVCIDPIVLAHSLRENDNVAMGQLMGILAQLARDNNCAVDFLAHERKASVGVGPAGGDVERLRGASAFKDGARLVYTLTPMSFTEAEQLGVKDDDRRFYVRLDSAKTNIAPTDAARWLHLASIPLNNPDANHPAGDHVQAAQSWSPTDVAADVLSAQYDAAIAAIGPDRFRLDVQSHDWIGYPIARALALVAADKANRPKIKKVALQLLAAGRLVELQELDPHGHKKQYLQNPKFRSAAP